MDTRRNGNLTLSEALEEASERFSNSIAIQFGVDCFSYGDLNRASGELARRLISRGLECGDRVAIRLSKGMAMVLLYLGCLRSGIIPLPINPAYTEDELRYFLSDSGARLLIAEEGTQPLIEPVQRAVSSVKQVMYVDPSGRRWAERGVAVKPFVSPFAAQPDDGAIMFYTSGTTGPPKGCIMSQKSCVINLQRIIEAWGITREDRLMHVLPLNHGHGLFVALTGCLLAGCFILMKDAFDAEEVLKEIDEYQLTLFMGVPTHYHRFLKVGGASRFSLSSMRLFISGSASLPEEVFKAFEQRFGHTILERYGMTEIGIHLTNPLNGRRLAGKVGLPLPGTEARIADISTGQILGQNQAGELEVRGPNVFSGYWRKPEETEKNFTDNGWFKTGDLAKVDENGYFSIVGRVKDLIISGGLNISPQEVEKALNTHRSVLESAVIGVPDSDFGERVVAYIVLKEKCKPPSLKEIQDKCREHLASYKKPKEIYVVDQLPRNTLGKVLKKELRADYARKSRFGM